MISGVVASAHTETGVSITDNFTGDEGSALAGQTTTTGAKTWAVTPSTTYLTATGVAYASAFNTSLTSGAYVDAGVADCTVQVSVPAPSANGRWHGLLFRYIDDSNFWYMIHYQTGGGAHRVYLQGFVAGVNTYSADFAITNATHTFKVVLLGTSIKGYVDDVLTFDITDAGNLTATKHGLTAAQSGGFDDFSVTG